MNVYTYPPEIADEVESAPEKLQKLWKDGRCYIKDTQYIGTPTPGDGPKPLHITWIEIPTRIDPLPYKSSNERAYIGKYASYYWHDTGEIVTPQNEKEREHEHIRTV